MVHVGLLDHGAHGMLDGAVFELIEGVLLPERLEVEKGPIHEGLEKSQVAGMCYCLRREVKVILERSREAVRLRLGIPVMGQAFGSLHRAAWRRGAAEMQ